MSILPFSPPRIDDEIISEVTAALKSGWITTGPRTKQFEQELSLYNQNPKTLCLNSATAGLEVILRWYGVQAGDEVILPAYTYSATANVIIHCGAKPVFVDVGDDFNIDVEQVRLAITSKTKVIMPVDFGGWPCDYRALNALIKDDTIRKLFVPATDIQEKLGRILLLSDAAHSLGAQYHSMRTGSLADVSVFSFHAVKNLTTAEGGAIALNLPEPFNNEEIYTFLCMYTLHGQNKDALAKTKKGNWRYDIVEAGFKCNMTDIMAAIGLVELKRYESETLPKRKSICRQYSMFFKNFDWAILPLQESSASVSSWHLYPLRIKGADETRRDQIIQSIFDNDVSVNVHFIPVPMMSYYKGLSYSIMDYPNTYRLYSSEISLPVYFDLDENSVNRVCEAVQRAVEKPANA